MRIDRQLTLLVAGACGRRLERTDHSSLPVLMYHSVSDRDESRTKAYYQLTTRPIRFAEHLRLLRDEGFTGVSLEEGLAMPPSERKERRPVALTFDDGFADFYANAWPMLREVGFTATMYLPTGFIGAPRRSFLGRACLNWDEVREMRQSGIQFGSHTVEHRKLHELPWSEIKKETLLSKRELEEQLSEEITSFAYPFAFPQEDRKFVDQLSDILQGQGYRSCATTMIGRHSAFRAKNIFVPRLPANSSDDGELLRAKLKGHYDWMAIAQRSVRWLRSCRH